MSEGSIEAGSFNPESGDSPETAASRMFDEMISDAKAADLAEATESGSEPVPEPPSPGASEPTEPPQPGAQAPPEPPQGGTEPPTEPPPSAPPPEDSQWLKQFQARTGVDLSGKYANDEAAQHGIANLVKLMGVRDQDAQIGRMLRDNPAGVYQYLQQQFGPPPQQPQQQQPEPTPPKEEPSLREEMETWENQVVEKQHPETGQRYLEPAPGAPPDAVQRYHAAQRKFREALYQAAEMVNKPPQQPQPTSDEELWQKFQHWNQSSTAAQRDLTFTMAYLDKNAKHLFPLDVNGNPIRGDDGKAIVGIGYSKVGQEILGEAQRLQAMSEGRLSNEMAIRYANDAYEARQYRRQLEQQAQQPPPQQQVTQAPAPPAAAQHRPDIAAQTQHAITPKDMQFHEALGRVMGLSKDEMREADELVRMGTLF